MSEPTGPQTSGVDLGFVRSDQVPASPPSFVSPRSPDPVTPPRLPSPLVSTAVGTAVGAGLGLGLAALGVGLESPIGLATVGITAGLGGVVSWLLVSRRHDRSALLVHDRRLRQLLGTGAGTCLWTWGQDTARHTRPNASRIAPEPAPPSADRTPAVSPPTGQSAYVRPHDLGSGLIEGRGEAWFSESWEESFGIAPGIYGGPEQWFDRIHPEDLGGLVHALERVRAGDQAILRRHYRMRVGGEWRWIEVHARALDMGDGPVIAGAVQDVTVHHSMQERLTHTAFHDALTGLPNRALFLDRLTHCTARARRNPRYRFAVVYLDVDDFKLINDSLGHHAGDALLAAVARRLQQSARPGDTVARIGGDEFTVLLEPVDSIEDAERVAMRLRSAVHGNVEVAGHGAQISTSVGIAFSSPDYIDPLDILRDADTAMYHAKRSGPGRQKIFDQAMRDSAMRRLRVESELRRGLDGDGLVVHYQPIVNLTSGVIEGFEALVRLISSAGHVISPGEFIPLAEAQGLIDRVLDRVLDDSTRLISEWSHRHPNVYISVNVSARSIHGALVERVGRALARYDLPTSVLKLELTESVLLGTSGTTAQTLETLRKNGIGLYIDDFGTGYSSLSYLHQFPADRIKLDRTFVLALDGQRMPEIVETIVTLSQRIGAAVIAEGIETRTQLAALRDLGCTAGQGFFFAPALPAETATRLLDEQRVWPIEELMGRRPAEGFTG